MRKLLILFALGLPALGQISVHVYDPNAYIAIGAPAANANCTGMISGQSNTTVTGGASTIIPITNQPFTIANGAVDIWLPVSQSGLSYTINNLYCTSGTNRWQAPVMTWVPLAPAPHALTITAATTPTASDSTWTTTFTVIGSIVPWATGQNAYLTSSSNAAWQGGYLVTAVGSSTITVTAATAPPSQYTTPPPALVPMPTVAWSGTGTFQEAGPLSLQQIQPPVVYTPNPGVSVTMGGDVGNQSNAAIVVGIQGNPVSNLSPTTGQGLIWNGSAWAPSSAGVSVSLGGDLTGTSAAATVVAFQGEPISSTLPTLGQGLLWNGSAWLPGAVVSGTCASSNIVSTSVCRDSSGNFAAGQITAGLTGNASTSTSLLNVPTICPSGQFPTGVDAFGNAVGCTPLTTSISGSSTVTVTPSGGGVILSLPSELTLAGTTTGTFSGPLTGDVTGNASGSAATFTGTLVGDVTGTQSATVAVAINGTTVPTNSTVDAILQTGGTAAVGFWNQWPDCSAPGYHVTYNPATHAIGCDNVGGTGGSVNWNGVGSGTNSNALLMSGTLGATGGGTITATSMPYSGLTGTVPTWNQSTSGNAATASALAGTPTTCSGVNFSRGIAANGNSTCAQPSNVTGSAASFTGNLTGDVTSIGMATTLPSIVTGSTQTKVTYNAKGQVTAGAQAQFSDIGGTAANAQLVNSGALNVTAGTGLSGGGSVALGNSVTLSIAFQTDPSWLTLDMGAGRIIGGSLGTGMLKNITGTNAPVLGTDGADYISPTTLNNASQNADLNLLTTTGNVTVGGSLTLSGSGVTALHFYNLDGSDTTFAGVSTGVSQNIYMPTVALAASAPLGLGSSNQLANVYFTGDATNVTPGSSPPTPTDTLYVQAEQGHTFTNAAPALGQQFTWNTTSSGFWGYTVAPTVTGQVNIWNNTSGGWALGSLTGDLNVGGSNAAVVGLNGTLLGSLANGLLTNTTGTGVPTITALPLAIANGGIGATTAGAYTVFGNATGSTAAPGFTATPSLTSVTFEGATSGSATISAGNTGGGLRLGGGPLSISTIGTIQWPAQTYSTITTDFPCNSGNVTVMGYMNDSNAASGTITGGSGSHHVIAICNGTNYVVLFDLT